MITLSTLKWRRAMEAYRHQWGLAEEKGFAVETRKPLGKPARNLLRRIQKNMVARRILPATSIDGTLNTKTKNLLIPPATNGDKAVAYALSQNGVHESPWGSNNGVDVHRYQSSTGAYGEAWCASFFWYCWIQAGYKGHTSANAWASTDSLGTRIADISKAHPGDGVSLNEGEGHIGLYLSHDSVNVKIVSGNTNDAVGVGLYPISMIHSICRPIVQA